MAVIPLAVAPQTGNHRRNRRAIIRMQINMDDGMHCNHGCNPDASKAARRRSKARFSGLCGRSGPDLISSSPSMKSSPGGYSEQGGFHGDLVAAVTCCGAAMHR
jgi:hypothetical protein